MAWLQKLACLVLVLLLHNGARAQNRMRFQGDEQQGGEIRLFTGYWITEFHGDFAVGDGHEAPSDINVRRDLDLDLDSIGTPYFELFYKDAAAFISAEYFFVQGRGKEVIEQDFNYDGLRYVQGGFASSKLVAQALSLNVGYALFSEFGVDVSIVAGLRYVRYSSKITQIDAGSKRNTAEGYMPVIGLRADTKLFGDLGLYADVNWLQFSINNKSVVANHFEWSVGAFYDFTDYLSVHAEWAVFENHLDARHEDYDIELQGLKFGLALRF